MEDPSHIDPKSAFKPGTPRRLAAFFCFLLSPRFIPSRSATIFQLSLHPLNGGGVVVVVGKHIDQINVIKVNLDSLPTPFSDQPLAARPRKGVTTS